MLTKKDKTRRTPEATGFADHRKLPKGMFGRALCRFCSDEVPYPRRTFCSDECVHEWQIRTNPGYAAQHVLERDKGVCALCGRDCLALLRELKQLRRDERVKRLGPKADVPVWLPMDVSLLRFVAQCDALKLPPHLRRLERRLWEMDHTLPIVEGGGCVGLQGLRTLCFACHREETAVLRKRLALARKKS